MSVKQESTVDSTGQMDSEHGGFLLSRRSTLRGLAGAGLLGLVGIPAMAGTAAASHNTPIAVSDAGTVVTQYLIGTEPPFGSPVAVNQPAQTYQAGGMHGTSWPETDDATSVWWGNVYDRDKAVWFEKEFTLSSVPSGAELSISCDNDYQVWVNDQFVGQDWGDPDHPDDIGGSRDPNDPYDLRNVDDPYSGDGNWGDIETYDVTSLLGTGSNKIVAVGRNWKSGGPSVLIFQLNAVVPPTIPLDIDVKPGNGDETDPVNPNAKGNVPVVVYSTDDFDATTLDVSTLRFGSTAVVDADGGAGAAHGGHEGDVDGDGLVDLMLHFPSEDAGFADGDEAAKLVGQTDDGTDAVGTDAVRVVGGGRGNGRGR